MSAPAKAPPVTVEVAVDSVEGGLAAERAGAHRLELCCALGEGGLTPSTGLLCELKHACGLPVMVMVRPRGGDFLYSEHEFAVLRADVALLAAAGADGLVLGVLTADGDVDRERMRGLLAAAAPLPVTFHRAFDLCRDGPAALDALVDLGVARVLTSGQHQTASDGADAIQMLVARARGRIAVMAGGGVRAPDVAALVARTGVRQVHLAASTWAPSAMRHRNAAVPLGRAGPADEYALRRTDGTEVARVVAAVAGA